MDLERSLNELAHAEALPDSYPIMAKRWFAPLADWLAELSSTAPGCLLVGVHGAQGTGKTTLCQVLTIMLAAKDLRLVTLSLDDFYFGLSERERLAQTVHPLLRTRGVPGTHDVELLGAVLDTLLAGGSIDVPVFDKAADDRLPEQLWRREGPADILLLEGWCVGVGPQPESALVTPANDLEAREDAQGVWRRHVNEQLAGEYAGLYGRLDRLVMLKAPSLENVLSWRRLQEAKLATRRDGAGVMNSAEIERFVQHYERITRHALATLPDVAHYVLQVAEDHSISGAQVR
jgi:D-glycerate 3-kinase